MTVKEILEMTKGNYDEVEIYADKNLPRYSQGFNGYGLVAIEMLALQKPYINDEVKDWKIMDKEEYESTVWIGDCNPTSYMDMTFGEIFGSDDAKILVIVMPYDWYERHL